MLIGVPKEIKVHEYRVGLLPGSVRELTTQGHAVLVEAGAGVGAGCGDEDYLAAGAEIVADAVSVFARAQMIVKVKEPQAAERAMLRPGQILFTYLHLAADKTQTEELLASGAICIAYETIGSAGGGLPLLAPMSAVAGRLSVQAGARCLEKVSVGRGVLLGGVPGVMPAQVVILGAGVVGSHAATIAVGMGARVTVLDRNLDALHRIQNQFGGRLQTVYSTRDAIASAVRDADLLIGGVLVPGAAAPKLLSREMVASMPSGAAIVDVAIDQGGCCDTSRATTHADPIYVDEGVVHYCVTNMPGAVPRTSSFALNNATLPYVLRLAGGGVKAALWSDPYFLSGLNICAGQLTNVAVGVALDIQVAAPELAVAAI